MQKLPKFGERGFEYDAERENECDAKVLEFIMRGEGRNKTSECEVMWEWEAFKVLRDRTGIFHNFGQSHDGSLYLSSEEAFFLATRRLISIEPSKILYSSQARWHNILFYSYCKRKGIVSATSLAEALNKNCGSSRKVQKGVESTEIKSADDALDLSKQVVHVEADGEFKKVCVRRWNADIML